MVKKLFISIIKLTIDFLLFLIDSIYILLRKKNSNNLQAITIVRLDAIGDFIIYISSRNLVPKEFSRYKKILICNELVFELAKSLRIFDEIIPVNLKKFNFNLLYRLKILSTVSRIRCMVTLHPTFSRCFKTGDSIVRFLPSRIKIGFNGDFVNQNKFFRMISDCWYSELVQPDPFVKMEIERNHEFIEKVSNKKISFKKFIPTLKTDVNFLGLNTEKFILISPGASSLYKCWPSIRFQELIEKILEKYNFNIVLCGTRSEELFIKQIKNNINSRFVGLSLDQTLLEYIELVRNAELLIGNDSSSIHIANFVNTKSICLYGGILPGRFLPYPKGIKNAPLVASKSDCKIKNWSCLKSHNCLNQILVEDVMNLVDKIFNGGE